MTIASSLTNRHGPGRQPATAAARPYVALERALLCLDCEAVYEMGAGPCPACGSQAAWSLGRLLSRPAAAA